MVREVAIPESPAPKEALAPNAQVVIETFTRCTGIQFHHVAPPFSVQMQAAAFFGRGYSLEALELVVAWTKKKIAERAGGYSERSLRWHNIFGPWGRAEEWLVFEERLSFAQKDRGLLAKLQAAKAPKQVRKEPTPQRLSAEEEARIRENIRSAADEFWRKMRPQTSPPAQEEHT